MQKLIITYNKNIVKEGDKSYKGWIRQLPHINTVQETERRTKEIIRTKLYKYIKNINYSQT